MEREIKYIKVNIFGNIYTLKTDADEEYIKKLARYLNKKREELLGKNGGSSLLKDSIMVSLNIADEYHRLKEEVENIDKELGKKTEGLIKKIEDGLTKEYIEIK